MYNLALMLITICLTFAQSQTLSRERHSQVKDPLLPTDPHVNQQGMHVVGKRSTHRVNDGVFSLLQVFVALDSPKIRTWLRTSLGYYGQPRLSCLIIMRVVPEQSIIDEVIDLRLLRLVQKMETFWTFVNSHTEEGLFVQLSPVECQHLNKLKLCVVRSLSAL